MITSGCLAASATRTKLLLRLTNSVPAPQLVFFLVIPVIIAGTAVLIFNLVELLPLAMLCLMKPNFLFAPAPQNRLLLRELL
jgi:hypothetical protein